MTEFVDREEDRKYKGNRVCRQRGIRKVGSIRVTEFVDREEDRKYKGDRVCRQRGG